MQFAVSVSFLPLVVFRIPFVTFQALPCISAENFRQSRHEIRLIAAFQFPFAHKTARISPYAKIPPMRQGFWGQENGHDHFSTNHFYASTILEPARAAPCFNHTIWKSVQALRIPRLSCVPSARNPGERPTSSHPGRPKDGRYGENPNRMQHYYQFQVVLKPAPEDILDLYLGSLAGTGSRSEAK